MAALPRRSLVRSRRRPYHRPNETREIGMVPGCYQHARVHARHRSLSPPPVMLVLTTACALMRGAVARFYTNRTGPRGRGVVKSLTSITAFFFFLYNLHEHRDSCTVAALLLDLFFACFFGALILVCRLCTTGGLCFPFCYAQNVCFGVCVCRLLVGGRSSRTTRARVSSGASSSGPGR